MVIHEPVYLLDRGIITPTIAIPMDGCRLLGAIVLEKPNVKWDDILQDCKWPRKH